MQLPFFRGALHGGGGDILPLNGLHDHIELIGTDFALIIDGGEAVLGCA
jgi:hypothetical protein